jgi:peptide/nickel transport system substrate-binding protein
MSMPHQLKGRQGFGLLALGVVMASVIIAGSVGASNSPASTASTASTHATATCTKPKGTLTYGISGAGISSLDPTTLSFSGQEPLQTLLYSSLTAYNPQGQVVPQLATKWKHSTDLKTYWFWLHHGVKYANGRPFTAADVVANVLRNLDPTVPSLWRPAIKGIHSVRAINKYEVRFKLSAPNADLPEGLAPVEMSDLTDMSQLNTRGNGTGPYKVSNYVPGQTLTLVPNPLYFGPKACLQAINIVREPDPTSMVTDFTSGKLSVIWQAPLTALQTLSGDNNAYWVKPRLVSSEHLWDVDTSSPPFNNLLAREALSYAIDRATMVKAAFFGTAVPALANDLVSTANPIYDKQLKPLPFDLQKAKQLFTQAGVQPGTTFTFWALAGRRDEWITMAQILQQNLQKIGLNLSIQRNDISTWLAKFDPAGKKFPYTIVGDFWSIPSDPIAAFGMATSCDCNWHDAQYDALLKQAQSASDPKKRQALFDQMQAIFQQQLPMMTIAHQTNIIYAQKSFTGIWEDPAGTTHMELARETS